MAKSESKQLTAILKKYLGENVPPEMMKKLDPELLKSLTAGRSVPTLAEMLARKVVSIALDPESKAQWAIELIFDRLEGKAVQGEAPGDDGRELNNRLDSLTAEHLNSLAARFVRAVAPETGPSDPQVGTSGHAPKLLGLPKHGAGRAQNAHGKPPVAAGVANAGTTGPLDSSSPDVSVSQLVSVLGQCLRVDVPAEGS